MIDRKFVIKMFFAYNFLLLILLFCLAHKIVIVSGTSMLPTLIEDDILYTEKFDVAVLGDLYVVKDPDSSKSVVKRLVGLPGDIIECVDGILYRNGDLFLEEFNDGYDNYYCELLAGDYFFLGDNRYVSYDSRYWTRPTHIDEILYHVKSIIYPFNRMGTIKGIEVS